MEYNIQKDKTGKENIYSNPVNVTTLLNAV